MEAPLQIVGCLLSSKPSDPLIEGFVTAARRERAVVTARNAQMATFVRFNANDARLVAMACAAAAGADGTSLRFGFATAAKDRAATAQDAWTISDRSIARARDLAAAAGDGEVLVTPQLALLLIESGHTFQAREVRTSGGRAVTACAIDPGGAPAQDTASGEPPQRQASALASVFQVLLAQAEQIARRQCEIEARQDAAPGQPAPIVEAGAAEARPTPLQADIDAQLARLEARLTAVDTIEQRVEHLQRIGAQVEHGLADQLARHTQVQGLKTASDKLLTQVADVQRGLEGNLSELRAKVDDLFGRVHDTDQKIETIESRRKMVEEVQSRANGIVLMLQDIKLNLDMLGEQRAVVDHVGGQLARLDFTLQEAHNTLRALQREREVAERIEQSIKALRARNTPQASASRAEAAPAASPAAK